MLKYLFKIDKFLDSPHYKYTEIFLGIIILAYATFVFFNSGEKKVWIIVSGILLILSGIFDISRKLKQKIEKLL